VIAILVHFLGTLVIDSAIPPYAGSADAWFLAMWYLAFAAVDLIAVTFTTAPLVRYVLIFSFGWSLALAIEQLVLLDYMQQYDWAAQWAIDISLFAMLIAFLLKRRKASLTC